MDSDRRDAVSFHLITAPCILGLPATVSGHTYNFTAVLTEDSQVARIERQTILKVLHKHQGLALCVVDILSRGVAEMLDYHKRGVRGKAKRARSAMPVSTALRR